MDQRSSKKLAFDGQIPVASYLQQSPTTPRKRAIGLTEETHVPAVAAHQPGLSQPLAPRPVPVSASQMSPKPDGIRTSASRPRVRSRQKRQHRRDEEEAQDRLQAPFQSPPQPLKVAIPRLPREADLSFAGCAREAAEKHRVSHACEPCRSRKTKCSGERPICSHCREYTLHCVYADGKRDRAKREMSYLQERVDDLEQLLRQISVAGHGDSATQLAVQKALQKASPVGDEDDRSATTTKSRKRASPPSNDEFGAAGGDDEMHGEMDVSADVGSTGSNDRVTEDYGRDEETVNAGFFGKASDVAWIQRARREVLHGSDDERNDASSGQKHDDRSRTTGRGKTAEGGDALAVEDVSDSKQQEMRKRASTYHLDDFELNLPAGVNEYELPARPVADAFVDAYFNTVHSSFQILSKPHFITQYHKIFEAYGVPVSRRWRAMLNLVFAIGAKYSALTRAHWCGQGEHLVFFARARALGLDHGALWGTGDIEQVQVLSLGVLYLIASQHTNRAWFLSGLAIRYAQTLGLHLRNDSKQADMSDIRKERFVRIWWSIYALERLLEVMTGRPSSIQDRDVSTALAVPVEESDFPSELGTRRLYDDFPNREAARSQPHSLGKGRRQSRSSGSSTTASPAMWTPSLPKSITTPASSRPEVASQSPKLSPRKVPVNRAGFFIMRTQLSRLSHKISDNLYNADTVHHSWAVSQQAIANYTEQMESWLASLPFEFDFAVPHPETAWLRERLNLGIFYWGTMILIRRPGLCVLEGHIPNESKRSKEFNRRTAAACVAAAREVLKLIPDDPDPPALYSIGPWWSVLHHLTQASTVVMLELSFRASHVPRDVERILGEAKKSVNWLRAMAQDCAAADRAWHLMDDLLIRAAAKVGGNVRDMPHSSPRPAHPAPLAGLDLEAQHDAQAEAYFDWFQGPEQQHLFREFEDELGLPYSFAFDPQLPQTVLFPEYSPYHQYDPNAVAPVDPLYSIGSTVPVSTQPAGPVPTPSQAFGNPIQMDLVEENADPNKLRRYHPPPIRR